MSAEPPITILGAGGWIGTALVNSLRLRGRSVRAVDRAGLSRWLNSTEEPGTVINTIGLTSDFRQRPHDTVEAHVGLLSQVLRRQGLERLVYLSSTRVYARSADTHETAALPCLSQDPSDLYNLSKLLGEALVLQDPRPGLKVVRLSNVVGLGQPETTFVGAVLQAARTHGVVTIQQPPNTEKDYVGLDDVVRLLPGIAEHGQERLYNLGSGRNTSHAEVASWLEQQGVVVGFAPTASHSLSFPHLRIDRLRAEFTVPSEALAAMRI